MTEKIVCADELKAKIGPRMLAKMSPYLKDAVMSGSCTLQVTDGTVYRASSDDGISLAYKSAGSQRGAARRGRTEEAEEDADEKPGPFDMPLPETVAAINAELAAKDGKRSQVPTKIAQRLEGAAPVQVSAPKAGAWQRPETTVELRGRLANEKQDRAIKAIGKKPALIAARLNGDRKGAA